MSTSGTGALLRSAWAMRLGNLLSTDLPRKIVAQPTNEAGRVVWADWWFGGGAAPSYFGTLKRWTGAAWVKARLLTYVGGSWVAKPLSRWNGSAWVAVDATGG